ncbi:hypothetical protein ACVWWN_004560 [Mycobacterium sp. URHB0021]
MFEHIGVAHRLEEISLPCPGNVYHFEGLSDDEKPRTDFRPLPTRYPFYYKLYQNDFGQVLRENLRAQYGITPEYGRELTDLTQDHEKVTISIADHRYARADQTMSISRGIRRTRPRHATVSECSPCLLRRRAKGFDQDHLVDDQLGELAQRYAIGCHDARVILIRPDMYVGAHSVLEDAGQVVDFIGTWLIPMKSTTNAPIQ